MSHPLLALLDVAGTPERPAPGIDLEAAMVAAQAARAARLYTEQSWGLLASVGEPEVCPRAAAAAQCQAMCLHAPAMVVAGPTRPLW